MQLIPRYSVVMVYIPAAVEAETFHLRHHSRTNTSAAGTAGPIMASFDSGVPKKTMMSTGKKRLALLL